MKKLGIIIAASAAMMTNNLCAADGPDQLCMWTIKDKKNPNRNEDSMKGPCSEKVIDGTKHFASVFEVQGRKFRVEYLSDDGGGEPFKAKVNGKIGTMQEDNRYSKHFTSDDLSIQFSYDAVMDDPKLNQKLIQGTWAENDQKNCNAETVITIKGNTLTRHGGESLCKMYQVGKTSVANTGMIMMRCKNEETIDFEAMSFELANKGREAYTDLAHLLKCSE